MELGGKKSFKELEKRINGIKFDTFVILPLMTLHSEIELGE